MGVNFSNLVVRPGQDVFSIPMRCDPVGSRPGGLPYSFRAVWSQRPIDFMTIDGASISDTVTTISIRAADWREGLPDNESIVGPVLGSRDIIWREDDGVKYYVDDATRADGQGAFTVFMRRIAPDYPK
jgi:hypothetical protein